MIDKKEKTFFYHLSISDSHDGFKKFNAAYRGGGQRPPNAPKHPPRERIGDFIVSMKQKVLVVDTAAEHSGALVVLRQFYEYAKTRKDIDWVFVLGIPSLPACDNVEILKVGWTKKSWFLRLFFDLFVVGKIAKRLGVSRVISLENNAFPLLRAGQSVFLHQPLFFTPIKFGLRRAPKLWIYQNIIARFCRATLRFADRIVVQTQWLKDAAIKKLGFEGGKIVIVRPEVDSAGYAFVPSAENFASFFFPASPIFYKNHGVLLEACRILKDRGQPHFKVFLTLDGKSALAARFKNAGIDNAVFVGHIPHKEVFELYAKSVLVFPSYLESFGYPLAEARAVGAPVIAADTSFAREILEGYANASFFGYDDAQTLADIMRGFIEGRAEYVPARSERGGNASESAYWAKVVEAMLK